MAQHEWFSRSAGRPIPAGVAVLDQYLRNQRRPELAGTGHALTPCGHREERLRRSGPGNPHTAPPMDRHAAKRRLAMMNPRRPFHPATGTSQMSSAYSRTERSDENQPTCAVFMMLARHHAARLCQSAPTRRCVAA